MLPSSICQEIHKNYLTFNTSQDGIKKSKILGFAPTGKIFADLILGFQLFT